MTYLKKIQLRMNPNLRSSIYLIGGLICIIWIMLTPSGIFGKADAVGYAVCHRIDTRSFHIGIRQLPLCVRCTGQYIGVVIGLGFLAIFGRRRSGTPPKIIISVMVLLVVLYAVDGLNSYFNLPPFLRLFPHMPHLYQPSNVLRLFTGTGMGLVIAMVLYPAFCGSILPNPDPQPAIHDLKMLFTILSVGIVVDLLLLTEAKYVLVPAAFISAGGVVVVLSMVYTILWIWILRKENQLTKLSQVIPYAVAGFMTTMTQIALFDLIRFIITGTWSGLIFI